MLKEFWKEISWIEIGILCALFAGLLGLTLPQMFLFQCRSKQSEAKWELMRIHAAEQLYKDQHGHYASFETLLQEQRIGIRNRFYDYQVSSDSQKSIRIQAQGRPNTGMESDRWEVDAHRALKHVHDACGNR